MTSKHTDDDRWLAALAGQAEPDDAQTRQAASLRRYLELQDEREAPLERRAAGRMARRAGVLHVPDGRASGTAGGPGRSRCRAVQHGLVRGARGAGLATPMMSPGDHEQRDGHEHQGEQHEDHVDVHSSSLLGS